MTIDSQPDFNLNTADEEALRDRYHLPPRLIKRILNLRPFSSAADLRQRLWGIDAETMARLEEALPREPQQIHTLSEPEARRRIVIPRLRSAALGMTQWSYLGFPFSRR